MILDGFLNFLIMDYNIREENTEDLIQICRFASPQTQNMWTPCIKRLKSHDITPLWVASVLYLILDSYIGSVDDKNQQQFFKETIKIFNIMKKEGHNYVSKVNFSED